MHPRAMKTIKSLFSLSFLLLAFLVFGVGISSAAINPIIRFEGKVTNTDGTELPDGVYNFNFGLYDSPTGGTAIWSENQNSANMFSGTINTITPTASSTIYTYTGGTGTSTFAIGQYLNNDSASGSPAVLIIDFSTSSNSITVASGSPSWSAGEIINNRPFVEGGVIDIDLGVISDMSAVDFNQVLYLEVIFNGETMQPRKVLTAEPYAFEAASLGGHTADEFASLIDDESVTGEWTFDNILNIATTSSVTALTVTQNGTGSIVEFKQGASTYLSVLNDGRVQIGDYIFPADRTGSAAGYVLKIDLAGNLYWDADIAGSGGGSGLWASSSNDLFIYQADPGQTVAIGNNTTSTIDAFKALSLQVFGNSLFQQINIQDQEQIRFYDADSSNYMALQASSSMASDLTLTLPDNVGALGQALLTDGSGNMYWGAPTGTVYANAGIAGQIAYYASVGSTVSATSSIFLSDSGYFGVGTSTPDQLFTVGEVSGNQFQINSSGQVVDGDWLAGVIGTQYGGTGTSTDTWTGIPYIDSGVWSPTTTMSIQYGGTGISSYTRGDILYGSSTNILATLAVGSESDVLRIVNGIPEWVTASSSGIGTDVYVSVDAAGAPGYIGDSAAGGVLRTDQPISYTDGGDFITLGITRNSIDEDQLLWDTDQHLTSTSSPTFDTLTLSNLNLSAFGTGLVTVTAGSVGTTSDNNVNWDLAYTITQASSTYWDYAYDRVFASSSLWDTAYLWGDHDAVNYFNLDDPALATTEGGTGLDTYTTGDLLVGTSSNNLVRLAVGTESDVLRIVNGIPTWVTASSSGIGTDVYVAVDGAAAPGYIGDTAGGGVLRTDQPISYTDGGDFVTLGITRNSIDEDQLLYDMDQDVTSTSSPTFDTLTLSNLTLSAFGSGLVTVTADTVGTTANNTANWDLAYTVTQASSTYWDYAYDMLVASGSLYDYTYDTVNASSSLWDTAYLWGDHDAVNYFNLDDPALATTEGGTGLDTYTTGDLLVGTTSNNLVRLGLGGEGEVLRVVGGEISWDNASAVGVDEQVAIDGAATAGYIGATGADGILRTDVPLSYVDGGDFITLGITRNSIGEDQLLWDTDQHLTTTSTPTFNGLILTNALGIAYGGTGGNTATTARQSLGLQDVYEYGIDSTATSGWIWISDGVNRGHWVPSTTLSEAVSGGGMNASVFIGTTSVEYDGAFASGTLAGYAAANSICDAEYPDSHFCRVYDILVTVEQGNTAGWGGGGRAWVAEGPPGYTSNSNDCVGWTTNDSEALGAWWNYTADGGAGYLIFCHFTRPLACCSRN